MSGYAKEPARGLGTRDELVTHERYKAEIYEQMRRMIDDGCPHKPTPTSNPTTDGDLS
jgi:hypothetical protein